MKIFRGIKDILYKQIDHKFVNSDLTWCDYGPGTSYAYEKHLTDDYVNNCRHWAWLIEAEFQPKNPLYINQKEMMDEENMDEGFFIHGNAIERNNISDYAQQLGHDCIIFDYDESDPHILLLPLAETPEVISIELFSMKQEIVTKVKKMKLPFDGTNFKVTMNKVNSIDDILLEIA